MNTEVKTQSPIASFSGFMDKFKPQLELALPKHLNADRMARLALTAFSSSQKMQECDPKSIAAAIMTAGQLGLEPNVNGAGYLIPYGRTCTFVPGWKGLVDLVSRSGRGTVYTGVIFKDQDYTFVDGAKRDLIIHSQTDLDAPEDITHAYAIGWVKDASMPIIELWSVEKIKKHRDKYNKVGKQHYSFRDWEMYCRKVPLLQVLKYMPSSVELSNAMGVSYAAEAGRGATIENGIVIDVGEQLDRDALGAGDAPATRTESVKEALKMRNKEPEPATMAAAEIPDAAPTVKYAQVADKISKADGIDVLELAGDFINMVEDAGQRIELTALFDARLEELKAAGE